MPFKEKLIEKIFLLIALSSITILALITFFIFEEGLPLILKIGPKAFLFGEKWIPSLYDFLIGVDPSLRRNIIEASHSAFGSHSLCHLWFLGADCPCPFDSKLFGRTWPEHPCRISGFELHDSPNDYNHLRGLPKSPSSHL
jgi:hypothetical protein